jgi:hypothetical protein
MRASLSVGFWDLIEGLEGEGGIVGLLGVHMLRVRWSRVFDFFVEGEG